MRRDGRRRGRRGRRHERRRGHSPPRGPAVLVLVPGGARRRRGAPRGRGRPRLGARAPRRHRGGGTGRRPGRRRRRGRGGRRGVAGAATAARGDRPRIRPGSADLRLDLAAGRGAAAGPHRHRPHPAGGAHGRAHRAAVLRRRLGAGRCHARGRPRRVRDPGRGHARGQPPGDRLARGGVRARGRWPSPSSGGGGAAGVTPFHGPSSRPASRSRRHRCRRSRPTSFPGGGCRRPRWSSSSPWPSSWQG